MPGGYDAIIIGSGFGGSVTACRLAESGARVLVLERGRRWDRTTYPRQPGDPWVWNQRRPASRNGWLDFRVFRGACVAQGAGVGGGSLIYANVQIDAPPATFADGWPPEITAAELAPYYARVAEMLQPQPVPAAQRPARFDMLAAGARALGHEARVRPLPLAITFDPNWTADRAGAFTPEAARTWTNAHGRTQGTCVHCGNCYIGCAVNARNTLDLNYLARAEARGAEIRPLHLVRAIAPIAGGYRIEVDRIERGRLIRESLTAPRVILAAGSLGSTELLLRCRDELRTLPAISPALGRHWSPNGDFMTISVQKTPVYPTHGPTITGGVDFLDADARARFLVEDGGFPDVFRGFFEDGMPFQLKNAGFTVMVLGLALLLRRQGPFNHLMPWFAQSVDASDGRLYLGRRALAPWKRDLKLDWRADASRETIAAVYEMQERLAGASGGTTIVPYAWTLLKMLITPHPLGGCRMAASAGDGVVDHLGRVYGCPNLFVADGSIVPRALGLNPSKTIAALAERIAAHLHG